MLDRFGHGRRILDCERPGMDLQVGFSESCIRKQRDQNGRWCVVISLGVQSKAPVTSVYLVLGCVLQGYQINARKSLYRVVDAE